MCVWCQHTTFNVQRSHASPAFSVFRGREGVFRYRKRAFSGFTITNAAQHKRPTAGACPALLRRPEQAGSETGSSVGIAYTTYLGFFEDKESHIEVSRLCNQYKYALPTSEIARKLQDEARGHCLTILL